MSWTSPPLPCHIGIVYMRSLWTTDVSMSCRQRHRSNIELVAARRRLCIHIQHSHSHFLPLTCRLSLSRKRQHTLIWEMLISDVIQLQPQCIRELHVDGYVGTKTRKYVSHSRNVYCKLFNVQCCRASTRSSAASSQTTAALLPIMHLHISRKWFFGIFNNNHPHHQCGWLHNAYRQQTSNINRQIYWYINSYHRYFYIMLFVVM